MTLLSGVIKSLNPPLGSDFEFVNELEAAAKNILNKNDIRAGFYASTGNGGVAANSDWRCSGFIKVNEGESYTASGLQRGTVGFFSTNEDGALVSATAFDVTSASLVEFTVPAGVEYVVVNISNDPIIGPSYDDTAMLALSSYSTFYDPYDERLYSIILRLIESPIIDIIEEMITPLALFGTGKNLLNKDEIRVGFYVSAGSGGIAANSAWRCSGFIEVTEGQTYTASGLHRGTVGFFTSADDNALDSATSFVSTSADLVTFTVPVGVTHVVINISNIASIGADYHDTAMVEVGSVATDYEEFYNQRIEAIKARL